MFHFGFPLPFRGVPQDSGRGPSGSFDFAPLGRRSGRTAAVPFTLSGAEWRVMSGEWIVVPFTLSGAEWRVMSGEWIVLPFTLSVAERSRRASGPTATSLPRKNVTPYPGSSPGQALIRGWSPGGAGFRVKPGMTSGETDSCQGTGTYVWRRGAGHRRRRRGAPLFCLFCVFIA